MRRALVLAAVLLVPPLAAQRPVQVMAGLSGVGTWAQSDAGQLSQRLSGWQFGGDGTVSWRRFTADLGYWQGSLDPASDNAAPRDVVEGYALFGYRILPWLSARVGPHAWAYTTDAGTQRWFLWEFRVHAEGMLMAPAVRTYFELWGAPGGSVNAQTTFGSGVGGEGGLRLRLSRWPVWMRLSYSVEQARLSGGAQNETLQRLVIGAAWEWR